MEQVMEQVMANLWLEYALTWGTRLAAAAGVFFFGRIAVRWLCDLLQSQMVRYGMDHMLAQLIRNIAQVAAMVVIVISGLDQLGIDTTSTLAVLGAAGLAVGLALKDSLSNFAAGVMIAAFRPFKIGHYIEAAGTSGTVHALGMFNTTLLTPDNCKVVVPNRMVYDGTIINYSAEEDRRIDMVFGIGYRDDIEKARALVQSILAADPRIFKEPPPMIVVLELADSAVNLGVRPWCKGKDYWDLRFHLVERIKYAFDENGITIPLPQRQVHMHASSAMSDKTGPDKTGTDGAPERI